MDDARARRRSERKRTNSSEGEVSDQADVNTAVTRNRPKLSPIKESKSQRRRRRVSQDDDGTDCETKVEQADPVKEKATDENENGQTERKRRKKSKKTKDGAIKKAEKAESHLDSTLISQIQELGDDIVEAEEPVILNTTGDAKDGMSQPISNVFVEFPNGFKEMGRSALQRGSTVSYISGAKAVTTTIDIASQCQLVTHGILSILHGVLAGIAVAVCIMIAYLHEPFQAESDFLQHYKVMAYSLEAIFFVLLSLCLLNALDRCDPGHSLSLFIQGLITFDATAILVILYSVALVLSLSIVNTEDKMGLLTYSNATLQEESGEMHGWWVVGICRCILVSLAWVIFALRPFKYSLLERIQELTEEVEMPAHARP